MDLEDLIHETLSHRGCCKRVLKSAEMIILGKEINNHHGDDFDLFPDLGKPVIKCIEMSFQIAGGIGSSCSVPKRFDYFSLVALTHITFGEKITNVLFHTIPEKRTFDPVIGFGEP
jgi:hypothetical protein